jgi:hypothetical protein
MNNPATIMPMQESTMLNWLTEPNGSTWNTRRCTHCSAFTATRTAMTEVTRMTGSACTTYLGQEHDATPATPHTVHDPRVTPLTRYPVPTMSGNILRQRARCAHMAKCGDGNPSTKR